MAYGHDCYGAQYYKNHLICISSLIILKCSSGRNDDKLWSLGWNLYIKKKGGGALRNTVFFIHWMFTDSLASSSWEVHGWNPSPNSSYSDQDLQWSSLVSPQIVRIIPQIMHGNFLLHPFHPTIWHYTVQDANIGIKGWLQVNRIMCS